MLRSKGKRSTRINSLRNQLPALIIGAILGTSGTIVAQVVSVTIVGHPDPQKVEMERRQKWPWRYTISEPYYLFPREINDGERDEIAIYFHLRDDHYSGKDLILRLYSSDFHGVDFAVSIAAKHANGNPVNLGSITFDKQGNPLERSVHVPFDSVGPGANTFRLKNASPRHTQRWLSWDYLTLRSTDDELIWEIGKKDGSSKEFHDLRFRFP